MSSIEKAWYEGAKWLSILRPFSFLAERYARSKRKKYLSKIEEKCYLGRDGAAIPLIVVGNISVGGTGKTPFTIALSEYFISQGKRVGIVSRGYGSKSKRFPFDVMEDCSADLSGDEPLLLKQRLGCPVVIDPDRTAAVDYLLLNYDVDVLISDDGMQHYNMSRVMEIALIDGSRGLGNGRMLPEGPLREPVDRLSSVDFVVVNSAVDGFPKTSNSSCWSSWFEENSYFNMSIEPGEFMSLNAGQSEVITGEQVYAVSGIGNPERFYNTLSLMGVKYYPKAFSDHHDFSLLDFVDMVDHRIVMTEKDAVKCRELDLGNAVYLSINAKLDDGFLDRVYKQLF